MKIPIIPSGRLVTNSIPIFIHIYPGSTIKLILKINLFIWQIWVFTTTVPWVIGPISNIKFNTSTLRNINSWSLNKSFSIISTTRLNCSCPKIIWWRRSYSFWWITWLCNKVWRRIPTCWSISVIKIIFSYTCCTRCKSCLKLHSSSTTCWWYKCISKINTLCHCIVYE